MKNLIIVALIISILSCIIDVIESRGFTKNLEASSKLKMANMMSHYLSKEEKAKYDREVEKAIKEAQGQVTVYTTVIGVGGIIISVGALMLNKKNMYTKTIGEEVEQTSK